MATRYGYAARPRDLVVHLLSQVEIDVVDDDARATGRGVQCIRTSESAARSRHDDSPAGQDPLLGHLPAHLAVPYALLKPPMRADVIYRALVRHARRGDQLRALMASARSPRPE